MLYIFYGQDDFSLQEELGRLRASLDDEMLAINTTQLEGDQTTPREVMAACDTVPFLGSHRLVIVHGLLHRFEPPQRGRRGAVPAPPLGPWQHLVDYVERLPPSTLLVLTDDEITTANSLLQALSPKAKVREFPHLRWAALTNWISRRAQDKGLLISPQAVRLLADSLGSNLWALDRELDKLANYAPQRRIEEADVRTMVEPARELSVFSLVDAAVERRPKAALQLLRQLAAAGTEGVQMLFWLTRQYRFLLLAKEMQQEGAERQAIAQHLGIAQDFVLRKVLEQAARYTMPQLKMAYQRLLEADLAIKRGQQGEELALELLIVELAGQQVG